MTTFKSIHGYSIGFNNLPQANSTFRFLTMWIPILVLTLGLAYPVFRKRHLHLLSQNLKLERKRVSLSSNFLPNFGIAICYLFIGNLFFTLKMQSLTQTLCTLFFMYLALPVIFMLHYKVAFESIFFDGSTLKFAPQNLSWLYSWTLFYAPYSMFVFLTSFLRVSQVEGLILGASFILNMAFFIFFAPKIFISFIYFAVKNTYYRGEALKVHQTSPGLTGRIFKKTLMSFSICCLLCLVSLLTFLLLPGFGFWSYLFFVLTIFSAVAPLWSIKRIFLKEVLGQIGFDGYRLNFKDTYKNGMGWSPLWLNLERVTFIKVEPYTNINLNRDLKTYQFVLSSFSSEVSRDSRA